MRFPAPLIPATLVKRYKRFLADVILPSGETITVHVANPGAMTGLATPGARVFLSRSDKASRKLPYSWELVEADLGSGPSHQHHSRAPDPRGDGSRHARQGDWVQG